MKRKSVWTAVVVVLLAVLAVGQEQYLDVYTAQVKPEKRADFDAITKKMVAANRQNGDAWMTMETVYGPGNRVTFISMRSSYGDVEKGMGAFEGALAKSLGPAGVQKLFQDFSQTVVSTRNELRRRRWDLSSNAPSDPAAQMKMLGESRWLRTSIVHVKAGQGAAFEGLLKDIKAAREKSNPPQTSLVSQAVAGQEGTVYYITVLTSSLGGFDKVATAQQLLGDEGYAKYLKTIADTVETGETVINRFLPELSNPLADVVAAAPDYWNPKPMVAAKAKAKEVVVDAAEKTKQ